MSKIWVKQHKLPIIVKQGTNRFTSIVQSQNKDAIFIFLFQELVEPMEKSKHRDSSHNVLF